MATAPSASTPPYLTFPALAAVDGLVHGLTTRTGGVSQGAWASFNLGLSSGESREIVEINRRLLTDALGGSTLRALHQVHGKDVAILDALGAETPRADVLVVRRPGPLGAVMGADCPLLLLVDPGRRALALVHSGWRGTVAGAVPAAIKALESLCGSRPADLLVAVAPSICGACYEVGPEVEDAVVRTVPGGRDHVRRDGEGRLHLDLRGALRAQLAADGVRPDAVHVHPACTYEAESAFYSWRRAGSETGRHALVAGWVE